MVKPFTIAAFAGIIWLSACGGKSPGELLGSVTTGEQCMETHIQPGANLDEVEAFRSKAAANPRFVVALCDQQDVTAECSFPSSNFGIATTVKVFTTGDAAALRSKCGTNTFVSR